MPNASPSSHLNPITLFHSMSLAAKLTTLLLFTALIPVLIISSYSFIKASTAYENTARSLNLDHIHQAASAMDQQLGKVPQDLSFLASFHNLNRYLQWYNIGEQQEAKRWLNSTVDGFQSFMQSSPLYMQLRVIDSDGKEVIRIGRKTISSSTLTIDIEHMRDVSKHDIFTNSMLLGTGEYHVSAMRLYRINGKIQRPNTPIIHYAQALIDRNGTTHGIVILTVFGQYVLDKMQQKVNADTQQHDALYAVNPQGYYISHANQDKTFAFDLDHSAGQGNLGNQNNLSQQLPNLWQAMQTDHGTMISEDMLYAFKKVYALKQDRNNFWYIIHAAPRAEALAELNTFKQVFFTIVILLLIGLILISRPFIARMVRPVRLVTANMQRLEHGQTGMQAVSYTGDDELGDLVQAADGMNQRITNAIKEANAISQGDFRSEIIPYSDRDELGTALQGMLERLQQVSGIAQRVAEGDLSDSLQTKGEHDVLAHALNAMIGNMRQTANHAHAIALGDFSLDIELRGSSDELGHALAQMNQTLRQLASVAASIAEGDYSIDVDIKGDQDQLGQALLHMTESLRSAAQFTSQQDWLKSGLAEISQSIQGKANIEALAETIMRLLPPMLGATHATFFVWQENNESLRLKAHHACSDASLHDAIKLGAGLTGQCGRDKKLMLIDDIPADYMPLQSSLGSTPTRQLIEIPLLADTELAGVIELASMNRLSDIQITMLEQLSPLLGMAVHALQQSRQTETLLEESQALAEELLTQEEELRKSNATLHLRAEELSASEEELQAQQEELRLSNEELIEKNNLVEAQKDDLSASASSLAQQAEQLRQSSQYKSDFLSNMSHELRTPLNSLLILSDMLAKNKDGNLSDKQIEFAQTIYGSGVDLLSLINDILDLAKVEAGKMDLDPHRFPAQDISDAMQRDFAHVANQQGIAFELEHSDDMPESLFSDAMRIKQVIKNLLSNAFKFTAKGSVVLNVSRIDAEHISFAVSDSGTGIAADKLHDIFGAFQQEDGSTSRKYGGTGLGLSICRELARLLGGHVTVQSEQGKGSTFSLIIPISCDAKLEHEKSEHESGDADVIIALPKASAKPVQNIESIETETNKSPNIEEIPNPLSDDRDSIAAADRSILIIEDDEKFATIQQSLVQENGFKAINALRGDHGLMLAQQYVPDAILLDLQLPVLDGMTILDRLKHHPKLRHIPVHVISCMDDATAKQVLQAGALSFVQKPARKEQLDHVLGEICIFLSRQIRRLLIVEDNQTQLKAMQALLAANDVELLSASSGQQALALLRKYHMDCMILDLSLPDMSGEEVLEVIKQERKSINQGYPLPIIVHTGRDLTEVEVENLQNMSKSIIIKGSYSPDRLLAETSLFLHQLEEDMSEEKQGRIKRVRELDINIKGKTILLVDDDIRNIYSLSSYLEGQGLNIITARDGLESLTELARNSDVVDLILMDIMMPEMDGYEAMQEIRKIKRHQNLPIIALTAKAMKGDREQCIAAGASDYITKPVDTDKLMSLIRVWLHE